MKNAVFGLLLVLAHCLAGCTVQPITSQSGVSLSPGSRPGAQQAHTLRDLYKDLNSAVRGPSVSITESPDHVDVRINADILFAQGGHELRTGTHHWFRALAAVLQQHRDVEVAVTAVDGRPVSPSLRKRTEQAQAQTVEDALREHGVVRRQFRKRLPASFTSHLPTTTTGDPRYIAVTFLPVDF